MHKRMHAAASTKFHHITTHYITSHHITFTLHYIIAYIHTLFALYLLYHIHHCITLLVNLQHITLHVMSACLHVRVYACMHAVAQGRATSVGDNQP